jgi:drug/metabolite transporter (DMT)-like permease
MIGPDSGPLMFLAWHVVSTPTIRTLGPALAASTALFVVGTSTATAATLNAYPVFGGQALRYALSALVLAGIVRVKRPPRARLTSRDAILITALSAVGLVGFSVCQVCATRYAEASTVGTVIAATPVVLAIAGPLTARRRPSPRVTMGAVVVAAGAGAATGLGHGSLAGFALSAGALACEVGFSLLAVPLLPKLGAVRVSMYAAAAAAPLSLLTGVVTAGRGALRMPTGAEAAGLAYLGVVVGAGAFLLWYGALPRLGPARAGLFYGFVPIGTMVTASVLGIGSPGTADLIGGAVVVIGLVIGLWPASPARPPLPAGEAPVGDQALQRDG